MQMQDMGFSMNPSEKPNIVPTLGLEHERQK